MDRRGQTSSPDLPEAGCFRGVNDGVKGGAPPGMNAARNDALLGAIEYHKEERTV